MNQNGQTADWCLSIDPKLYNQSLLHSSPLILKIFCAEIVYTHYFYIKTSTNTIEAGVYLYVTDYDLHFLYSTDLESDTDFILKNDFIKQ